MPDFLIPLEVQRRLFVSNLINSIKEEELQEVLQQRELTIHLIDEDMRRNYNKK